VPLLSSNKLPHNHQITLSTIYKLLPTGIYVGVFTFSLPATTIRRLSNSDVVCVVAVRLTSVYSTGRGAIEASERYLGTSTLHPRHWARPHMIAGRTRRTDDFLNNRPLLSHAAGHRTCLPYRVVYDCYFARGSGGEVLWWACLPVCLCVCLSVCPPAYLRSHMRDLYPRA